MALDPTDVDMVLDLMRETAVQAIAQAEAITPRPRGIPGTVVAADGPDVSVEPADDIGQLLPGTDYAGGVALGDQVLMLQFPHGGAFVIGRQP